MFYLLESFYIRYEPLGVAFTGSPQFDVHFGQLVASGLSSTEGFAQYHLDSSNVSAYSSNFGWGKLLVAHFAFQEEFPPPSREWLAFVRLAAHVQLYLDNPTDFPDLPGPGVREPGPSPAPRLRPLAAEVPLDKL